MSAFDDIYKALVAQARISFHDVVEDVEQHVVPSMASLAQNLVTIGSRQQDGTYTAVRAQIELDAQADATASVIVRFANDVLKAIQDLVNAVLAAVATVVNKALGVALLGA